MIFDPDSGYAVTFWQLLLSNLFWEKLKMMASDRRLSDPGLNPDPSSRRLRYRLSLHWNIVESLIFLHVVSRISGRSTDPHPNADPRALHIRYRYQIVQWWIVRRRVKEKIIFFERLLIRGVVWRFTVPPLRSQPTPYLKECLNFGKLYSLLRYKNR